MRARFILIRCIPLALVIVIFVFLINNNLYVDSRKQSSNSTADQQSVSEAYSNELVGESFSETIIEGFNNFNNLFKSRAYPISKANNTVLYESLSLTTSNLEMSAYLCAKNKNESTHTLVGFISKADSFERRKFIRETLAKQILSSKQKYLFFVAESLDETINELVDEEFETNEDIVRLDFIEDYYNLTLKSIAFLQYFKANCKDYKYAIKLDDDVFLNWYML